MKDILLGASIVINIILIAGYGLFLDICKKQMKEYKKKYEG